MRAGAPKRTPERVPAGHGIAGSDHADLHAGRVIGGRYRLQRPLDAKNLIWLAANAEGLHVVKTGAAASIRHEFEMLSRFRHPNIIAVRELVVADGGPCLVVEYLSGGDLVSLARAAPRHWLAPLADVIEALGFLHRQGFVHRDIKARNVLLDEAGGARLTDFGSACRAGSRFRAGGTSEAAIDPKRDDGPVVTADDVYALACLVHELLHGMPPGSGEPGAAPESAESLSRLVRACLETRDPTARPDLQSFRAVVKSLREQQRELA